MVLELQRAERVGHPLDGVREAVGVVVHRVDAPGIGGPMVVGVADPVDGGVPHVDVARSHVDLQAQHVGPVRELSLPHPIEQVEVLFGGSVSMGTFPTGLGEGPPVLPDLLGGEAVHVGLAVLDEPHRELVEPLEVVGREVEVLPPLVPQPPDVVLDRVDELRILLQGVGVVESQMAPAAELACHLEVEADRLGVADVQIPVGLGGKPRHHGVPAARLQILGDPGPDEVRAFGGRVRFVAHDGGEV